MIFISEIKDEDLSGLRTSPANPRIPDGPVIGSWENKGIIKIEDGVKNEATGKIYHDIKALKDAEEDVREAIENYFANKASKSEA